jgi:hypothetical protein
MSCIDMTIEQYSRNNSVLELFSNGKRIYKSISNIAQSTVGALILLPLGVAAIIIVPPTIIILSIILTYYLIRLSACTKRIIKISASNETYADLYDLFLTSQNVSRRLVKTNPKKQMQHGPFILKPLFWFVYKYELLNSEIYNHLEGQLFEVHDPDKIPVEDVECLRTELGKFDHDWDDDEIWADFQLKHHHSVV